MICSKCNNEIESDKLEIIDGQSLCHRCLYNKNKPYQIFPIGVVENSLERESGFGVKGNRNSTTKIHLFESQRPFLYKIEDEKWIAVIFYFHKQRTIRSTFRRGLDSKEVGIFASRTPERLSRIGISNVELIKVEDTTLYVKNFDAINGTPILDIKLGQKARW
ncbi:MAG: hypothetical protein BAJALOKI1v1_20045 [Promethearchaeota archaeon]|nr:MAG: hypothetical protein BAJALOKI1v1_20045 [Candidatus Lokiarchaeota archaeon]